MLDRPVDADSNLKSQSDLDPTPDPQPQPEESDTLRTQHRETLSYLQQVSDTIRANASSPASRSIARQLALAGEHQTGSFYHRGDQIQSIVAVVECILLHFDGVVSKSLPMEIGEMNTVVMEFKERLDCSSTNTQRCR